ncbi:MAG: EpsG family protein [Candidatus Malihini olakiniferum]
MDFIVVSGILGLLSFFEKEFLFKIFFWIIAIYFSFNICYGYDWINYRIVYEDSIYSSYTPFFFYEPGLLWVMRFFSSFNIPFMYFLGACSFCIYCSIYYFCNSMKNPSFSFFAIFSFFSVFILSEWIRQAIAISITMIGLVHERKGRKFVFYMACVIASFFHIFAVIIIPYSIIISWSGKYVTRFIIISTIAAIVIIYAMYNPDFLAFIPLIGEKIAQYGSVVSGRQSGLFEFILSSKLILVYFALFITLFILKKRYSSLSKSLCSVYILFISKFSSVLTRISFYFVPFIVMNMNDFISDKGRGMRTELSKLVCIILMLFVSSAYLWNPVFREGAKNSLTIFSTDSDIVQIVGKKCTIINKYYEEHTFSATCY